MKNSYQKMAALTGAGLLAAQSARADIIADLTTNVTDITTFLGVVVGVAVAVALATIGLRLFKRYSK